MYRSIRLFVLILTLSIQHSVFADNPRSQAVSEVSAHAKLKLSFYRVHGNRFDPNEDPLNPSEKTRKREALLMKIKELGLLAFAPIKELIDLNSSKQKIEALYNIRQSAQTWRNMLRKEYFDWREDAELEPIDASIYLLPLHLREQKRDMFYSADKISVGPDEEIDLLENHPTHPHFAEKVSHSIHQLHKDQLAKPHRDVFLLGAIAKVKITKSSFKVSFDTLLGLRPRAIDFPQQAELMTVDKLVIPQYSEEEQRLYNSPVARAKFVFTWYENQKKAKKPIIVLHMGRFSRFIKDNFIVVDKAKNNNWSPYMEGLPTDYRKYIPGIKVKVSLNHFVFDLTGLEVSHVSSMVRPGLHFGSLGRDFGGFKVDGGDDFIKESINQTLTEQKLNLVKSALGKIMGNGPEEN